MFLWNCRDNGWWWTAATVTAADVVRSRRTPKIPTIMMTPARVTGIGAILWKKVDWMDTHILKTQNYELFFGFLLQWKMCLFGRSKNNAKTNERRPGMEAKHTLFTRFFMPSSFSSAFWNYLRGILSLKFKELIFKYFR